MDKKVYNIPKSLIKGYDGHNSLFRIAKEETNANVRQKYKIWNRQPIIDLLCNCLQTAL